MNTIFIGLNNPKNNIIYYLQKEEYLVLNKEIIISENKKRLILNAVIKEFYPIIIDIEIDEFSKFFLIGVYLPATHVHLCFVINKNTTIQEIDYLKDELNIFFNFFNSSHKKKIYPLLVGHNIINFDLPLIFLFLNNNLDNVLDELVSFTFKIISDNKVRKNNIQQESIYNTYKFLKIAYCIDTIKCYNKNEYKSLFRFKIELYFNLNCKVSPIEFDFNKNVNLNIAANFNNWIFYNFNDLYYTFLLIYNKPTTNRLYSRGLLYKNISPKKINFSESLNKPDSIINTSYIIEKCNLRRKVDYMQHINFVVSFDQIKFLFNFCYYNTYKNFYGNNNLYKSNSLNDNSGNLIYVKNIKAKISLGGLHSTNEKVKKSEKLGYSGSQIIFANSNKNNIILMLDFQSFYVNLIINLLEQFPQYKQEGDTLNKLNQIRLDLKKKQDPNDTIFKIATLAYTGSLNYYLSDVFNPILYFSMTINGQLMCLELLNNLSNYINKIIEINTDGVIIYINKDYYKQVLNICNSFEIKYKIKIDTRDVIDRGFFFSSNKKIFIKNKKDVIVKGFQTNFTFNIEEKVLIHLLTNYENELQDFNKLNNISFYNLLYESFNFCIQKLLESKDINSVLNFHTIEGKKILIYFSKNPTYFGGVPNVTRWSYYPYPIQILAFENRINKNELIETVLKDIDISSYWSYILSRLNNNYLYNLNQNINKIKPLDLENGFAVWSANTKVDYLKLYLENKKILKLFYKLIKLGFIIYFKDRDKKSFPKTKMVQSNLFQIYNVDPYKTYKYFFNKYPFGVEKGVCLSVALEDSFKNSICCLDFDDIEFFFKKENFNTTNNIQKEFLNFILKIKKEGFFISSSMTNTPFDRFKIFFKLKNISNTNYETFKNHNKLNFNFSIENQASIVGPNLYGQNLISSNNFNNLIEIEYETYINFFNNKNTKLLNTTTNDEYVDQIIDLFDSRDIYQRTLYNNLFFCKKTRIKSF